MTITVPGSQSIHEAVQCPRCGYEVHGAVSAWLDSCPIHGLCSECGLQFEWGELLNQRRSVPRWCLEYGPANLRLIGRAFKTLLTMFRPWRFWTDLKMTHVPRWSRITMVPFIAALFLYPIFAATIGIEQRRYIETLRRSPAFSVDWPPALIGAYSALLPWSSRSFVRDKTGFYVDMPPRHWTARYRFQIVTAALAWVRRGGDLGLRGGSERVCIMLEFQAILTLLLCPLGFVALPISRRRAKVRWRHVLRISAYSFVFLVLPLGFDLWRQLSGNQNELLICLTALTTFAAALMIWWSAATGGYLKIPHAWAVGMSVVLLAYLMQLLALGAVDLTIDARWLLD